MFECSISPGLTAPIAPSMVTFKSIELASLSQLACSGVRRSRARRRRAGATISGMVRFAKDGIFASDAPVRAIVDNSGAALPPSRRPAPLKGLAITAEPFLGYQRKNF